MTKPLGRRLREAREAIPASLYQASRQTRIRQDFLENMERDNFRFLSGPAYIKGLSRSYARWLGLDEEAVVAELDDLTAPGRDTVKLIAAGPLDVSPKPKRPRWMVAAASAAMILLILSLSGIMNPRRQVAAPPKSASPQALISAPTSEAVAETINLTISIVGTKSWLKVFADGADRDDQAVFTGTLAKDASRTFSAQRVLRVVVGDLGAVRVSFNGRDLGVPGGVGEVGTLVFSPGATTFARG